MKSDAALARLADILPPPVPIAASVDSAWIVAAPFSILLLAGVIYAWRRRQRRIEAPDTRRQSRAAALEQLHALKTSWLAQQLSEHDAAYRLAAILRRGLGLHQLRNSMPREIDALTWQKTLTLLDHWRYRDDSRAKIGASHPQVVDSQRLPASVFEHAEQWLNAHREDEHV